MENCCNNDNMVIEGCCNVRVTTALVVLCVTVDNDVMDVLYQCDLLSNI